jgi:hypothetical protein
MASLALQFVTNYSNMEDSTMDNKKPDKKQGKTLPATQLSIVTLTDKDMSSVNGGRVRLCLGAD